MGNTTSSTEKQLREACRHGKVGVVKELLTAGVDKNSKDAGGRTPMHWAAWNGHIDIVTALLAAGADKNSKSVTVEGWTPLYLAADHGYADVVTVLLAAGADKNSKCAGRHTPLHRAADNGHVEVVTALLAAGADKNSKSAEGWTPMHWAATNGQVEVVTALLAAGADKNSKSAVGSWILTHSYYPGATPLHQAARYGHVDIVTALLAAGVDIMIEDNDGKRAIDLASSTILYNILERSSYSSENMTTGSYRRNEQIGRGAYGSVYRCTNNYTRQDFAMKQVDGFQGISEREARALKNESDILKRLDHPNIVKYYGYYTLDSNYSIAMEYVAGGSMRFVIRQNGPLNNANATKYLSQILTGISYLHKKKIIHRDLKADNILMSTDGNIKIADFGVSKLIVTMQSGAKTRVGTPYWMAPEVIRASGCDEIYTNKADIWAVGATAFELLTGNPPFFDIQDALLAMHKIGQVVDMKDELKFVESVNTPLREFIFSCVQLKPENRPSADNALKNRLFS